MRLKRLAVTACVMFVAAFAAIAIAVHFLDPRSLAVSLAASVKADTGRELSFGDVAVKLLPRPALMLSEVRFGNAAWGSQPWIAQISQVSADLDAQALFSGRLRIKNIALSDASVFLETDSDGDGNWRIGSAETSVPEWLKALDIDQFTLQALAITYRDGTTGAVTSAQLDAARIDSLSVSRPLQFSARATFGAKNIEATGTIGALAALMANAPAYPVELEAKVGAVSVSVHGAIDEPRELSGFRLALRAQAPEFADAAALFGATLPPLGPFRGVAQLTGAATAPIFSAIEVEVGTPKQTGLTARGELKGGVAAGGYEWQSTGVDFVVEGPQLSDLTRWVGRPLPALGRYRIAARVAGSTATPELTAIDAAIGGGEKPAFKLRGAVANLRAASGIDLSVEASSTHWWRIEAAADGIRLPPFHASARLRDARQGYRVDDLELRIADSTMHASLQVTQGGPRLRVTGKASSPLIDLARATRGSGSVAASTAAATSGSAHRVDYWELADADLEFTIGRLILPDGRQLQSGKGRLALNGGRLKASALRATLGGANVTIDGSVADPQRLAGLDLRLSLHGSELAELCKFFGASIAPVGPYQGRAQLHGSLHALGMTAIDASAGRPGQSLRISGQIEDAIKRRGMQLAITANVNDSTAAGRLFGADLPRLPALRGTARFTGPQDGYVFDDLTLALGRTRLQGDVTLVPGEPRPRVTANLSGAMLDLSEFPAARPKPGGTSPLLAADIEADIRFDRVVLPNRKALGPVSGAARITAGALELKQFHVAVDGASATMDGTINEPLTPAAMELMVNAKFTRGTGLAAVTGLRLPNMPAFTAIGKLTAVPMGYALAGLTLVSGTTTITGDVAVTRGAKRLKVSAKAISPLLDVSAFMHPAAADSTTKPRGAAGRVIPDVPLPLDALRVFDADLDLRTDAVKFSEAAAFGPLLVRATIADGLFTADSVQLAVQPGRTLSLSGTVHATQMAWAMRIEAKAIDLGEMLARFRRPGLVTGGSTDLALQVKGLGKSLSALVGSLEGDVRVQVGPHRVHNFAVNIEGGGLFGMLNLANPFRKTDPDTEVKCLALQIPIKNGVLTSERNAAIETAKYNAVLSGALNLGAELIDMAVTPIVTSGLGAGEVNAVVRVRGPLNAPTIGLDPVSVVKSAASIGAAVAVPGLGWIADALIRKAIADPHPCATALATGP